MQTKGSDSSWGALRRLTVFALLCAAFNVVIVAISGGYNTHFGPLWFSARNLFKPLLFLNGLFLVALVRSNSEEDSHSICPAAMIAPVVAIAIYAYSFTINFQHHDWTHRHISADHPAWASLLRLFIEPKADGFYRPVSFISLWLDYRIFHDALWGYHVQNVLLHGLNSLLVARFARVLGYPPIAAFGAALLFATSPAAYEAVVWPAARFDTLSTFFTLIALNAAPRSVPITLVAFSLGVLSKESAYAFAPMLIVLWPALDRTRWVRIFAGTVALCAVFIAIRLAIYGGIGGYSGTAVLNWKTAAALITRVLTLPLFAINSEKMPPFWARVDAAAFAVLVTSLVVMTTASILRRDLPVIALLFASAIPVANLAGWIGPSLIHSRFLYLPSAMLSILIGAVLARTPRPFVWIASFALICAVAAIYNELAYPGSITYLG